MHIAGNVPLRIINLWKYSNLKNIFELKIAEIIYKIINGRSNVSYMLLEFVKLVYPQHNYNTRFASNLNFVRPNFSKHSFQSMGRSGGHDVFRVLNTI